MGEVLTNVSLAFLGSQTAYVVDGCPPGATFDERTRRYRDNTTGRFRRAQGIFPEIQVERQSDVYYTYSKDNWIKDESR